MDPKIEPSIMLVISVLMLAYLVMTNWTLLMASPDFRYRMLTGMIMALCILSIVNAVSRIAGKKNCLIMAEKASDSSSIAEEKLTCGQPRRQGATAATAVQQPSMAATSVATILDTPLTCT